MSEIDNLRLMRDEDGFLGSVEEWVTLLIAERNEAREALKPFAEIAEIDIGDDETDNDRFVPMSGRNQRISCTVGMFRRASAVLRA